MIDKEEYATEKTITDILALLVMACVVGVLIGYFGFCDCTSITEAR